MIKINRFNEMRDCFIKAILIKGKEKKPGKNICIFGKEKGAIKR